MKFPFQTWFWINRRLLYIEMPFSYIKLFNWENIGYFAYPPEALFWSLKDGKYIHCRWMTSFVYLRNLATSDIPISGFPGCYWPQWTNCVRTAAVVILCKAACDWLIVNTKLILFWRKLYVCNFFTVSKTRCSCLCLMEPKQKKKWRISKFQCLISASWGTFTVNSKMSKKVLVSVVFSSFIWLGIICRPNHADQWTMDRSAVDQKGTFCRPSTLQTRLCADYIVNNFV